MGPQYRPTVLTDTVRSVTHRPTFNQQCHPTVGPVSYQLTIAEFLAEKHCSAMLFCLMASWWPMCRGNWQYPTQFADTVVSYDTRANSVGQICSGYQHHRGSSTDAAHSSISACIITTSLSMIIWRSCFTDAYYSHQGGNVIAQCIRLFVCFSACPFLLSHSSNRWNMIMVLMNVGAICCSRHFQLSRIILSSLLSRLNTDFCRSLSLDVPHGIHKYSSRLSHIAECWCAKLQAKLTFRCAKVVCKPSTSSSAQHGSTSIPPPSPLLSVS